MGLSASQAKLLSLTSRISDNELRAQFITNSKVRLAADSNEAAAEYMRALDSKNLQYASYDAKSNKKYQKLTAGAIMEYGDLKNQYGLINQFGQILVSSEDIRNYQNQNVHTLTDFLKLYGIEFKDNPKYLLSIKDIYGDKGAQYYNPAAPDDIWTNISNSADSFFNNIAARDPKTGVWTVNSNNESAYANLADPTDPNGILAFCDKFKKDNPDMTGIMGNWIDTLGNLPEYNPLPARPALYTPVPYNRIPYDSSKNPAEPTPPAKPQLVPSRNVCWYGADQTGSNGEKIINAANMGAYHGDHHFATMIWGPNGIASLNGNGQKELTNADGSVKIVSKQTGSVLDLTSGNGLDAGGDNTIKLLKELAAGSYTNPSDIAAQNLAKKLLNDLKELYCDIIAAHMQSGLSISSKTAISSSRADITVGKTLSVPSGYANYDKYIDARISDFYNTMMTINLPDNIFQTYYPTLYTSYQTANSSYQTAHTSWKNQVDSLQKQHELSEDAKEAAHNLSEQTKEHNSQAAIDAWDSSWRERKGAFQNWINQSVRMRNEAEAALKRIPPKEIPNENDPKCEWYTNLWYRMGSLSEKEKAPNANKYAQLDEKYMNNEAWLKYMLEIGNISMEQVTFNEKGSTETPSLKQREWKSIMYKNSSDISEQEDKIAVTKAEVKYEKALREIQSKDKQYDSDLKKLDTQHNALQTEYESLKSVIDKNVERSFKAFS
ncbi:MAG: hypothetical protein LBK53_07275 [Heliobacteriaceae bacterium]|jgi:hypothetical protein|nr:hypothetical protein [Heliobacteriaceae bacterium]